MFPLLETSNVAHTMNVQWSNWKSFVCAFSNSNLFDIIIKLIIGVAQVVDATEDLKSFSATTAITHQIRSISNFNRQLVLDKISLYTTFLTFVLHSFFFFKNSYCFSISFHGVANSISITKLIGITQQNSFWSRNTNSTALVNEIWSDYEIQLF